MNRQQFSLQPFTPIHHLDLQIHGNITRNHNTLGINYVFQGDLEKIDIPTPADIPTRQHELWQATCFEFFLGIKHSPHYWEFNLSPTEDWNIYRFDDYRQGMQEETAITSLPFTLHRQPETLQLSLQLDLHKFIAPEMNLDIGITAVVKDVNGVITYWALKHSGEEADFHLRNSFTIDLMGIS
ncbi:MAG: DOMON-like domain-containing protein [Calothrix sp. MO_167.B12]|nr:DOMON-like domain-containing protein [Calothrix sp. MO_167.B12]